MTNEQILKKAIEKAVKGKWEVPQQLNDYLTELKKVNIGWEKAVFMTGQYFQYIFSHSFAKAFWGNSDVGGDDCGACGYNGCYKNWKYQLTKMVLEKEPLKYLEKFL